MCGRGLRHLICAISEGLRSGPYIFGVPALVMFDMKSYPSNHCKTGASILFGEEQPSN